MTLNVWDRGGWSTAATSAAAAGATAQLSWATADAQQLARLFYGDLDEVYFSVMPTTTDGIGSASDPSGSPSGVIAVDYSELVVRYRREVTAPPACSNDTCADAAVIPVFYGTQYFTRDTCACTADYTSTCGTTAPSKDIVYSFTTPGSGTYKLTARTYLKGTYDPVIYLRANTCAGSQATCVDDCSPNCGTGQAAHDSTIYNLSLSAGTTYYLFIDGYNGSCGSADISVTFAP